MAPKPVERGTQKCGRCPSPLHNDDYCHDTEGRCHPVKNAVPAYEEVNEVTGEKTGNMSRTWYCACAKAGHPKPPHHS